MADRKLARTRHELSRFLRHHRDRLSPAQVGLPATGRRRTVGLRREEVAALAGVGLTWYTWLEQGRDIRVSEAFLLNLARALRLDDAECCHLFLLAQQRPPPAEAYRPESVSPLLQRLLDELVARPAYVLNLRWDVIAWNAAADRLFGFAQKERAERNLLRLVFTDPGLRPRLPAWQEDAPRLLAQFRCDLAVAPEEPALLQLVEELKSLSPPFRHWWERPSLASYGYGLSRIGEEATPGRRFQHQLLTVDEQRHLRLVVYFPEQDEDLCSPVSTL